MGVRMSGNRGGGEQKGQQSENFVHVSVSVRVRNDVLRCHGDALSTGV
jgi:hypothetical protein